MPPSYARRRLAVLAAGAALLTGAAYALSAGEEPAGESTGRTGSPGPQTALAGPTTTTIDVDAVRPSDVFTAAPGESVATGTGELHTYTVEVEAGLPVDTSEFAAAVETILADPRGWTAAGDVRLQRVGPDAEPSFRVRLATPATTDAHCAPLDTYGELSCRNGADVMINLRRWVEGAAPSQLPLPAYRQYMISHEVGHALGHDHTDCTGLGELAPVMLQQTLGLGGCEPNPWPYPSGT